MDAVTTLVRRRYAVPEALTSENSPSFVHPATGIAYALNRTGRIILESLRDEESVGALAQRIGSAFDVSDAEAHAGVESFLQEMSELGLVELRRADHPQSALRT